MANKQWARAVELEQLRLEASIPATEATTVRKKNIELGKEALARISTVAGRGVLLTEYFGVPTFDRLDNTKLPIVVDKLRKEALAMEQLGGWGRYGLTMRDKLLAYMSALHMLAEVPAAQLDRVVTWAAFKGLVAKQVLLNAENGIAPEDGWTGEAEQDGPQGMTDEELTAAVLAERKRFATKNKRTPYYMLNVEHPAVSVAYEKWRKETTRVGCPPGDEERTKFEIAMMSTDCRRRLEEHFKLVEGVKKMSEGGPCPYEK